MMHLPMHLFVLRQLTEAEVALRLAAEKPFIAMLFSYLTPTYVL